MSSSIKTLRRIFNRKTAKTSQEWQESLKKELTQSFAPQVRDGARAQVDTQARRHSGLGVGRHF